jgi:hypothetical protein
MESVLHQKRKKAAVVDVRVRENYGINLLGRESHCAVPFLAFFPPALEHAAVEKDSCVARFQLVL